MPKRFIDTMLWEKAWYRKLKPAEKCAWAYIFTRCDEVGVWDADTEIADVYIGEKIDWQALLEKLNSNVEVLSNGKWWLMDFVSFQYKSLRPEKCKPHRKYVELLKKHGLFERVLEKNEEILKGYHGTLQDTEEELDKEKEEEKEEVAADVYLTPAEHKRLVDEYGAAAVKTKIDALSCYLGNNVSKTKYKDHNKTIRNWLRRDGIEPLFITGPPLRKPCPRCHKSLVGNSCPACGWSIDDGA